MGWGWYTSPMHDRCIYTRECQPLTQQEEASFSVGHVTFPVGLSLHKRGYWSQSDAPPPVYPLPTYP